MNKLSFKGDLVELIPLDLKYSHDIYNAINKKEVWKYTWNDFTNRDSMDAMLRDAINEHLRGLKIPFIVLCNKTGKVAGLTRIEYFDSTNKTGEIGGTWLSPDYWKKGFNYEIKYLLLTYLFEELNAIRIQISISSLNTPSQESIEKIGAKKEGTLRMFRIKDNGTIHDKLIYSFIRSEWGIVKKGLISKLYD